MKRYPRRLNVLFCLLIAFSILFISPAVADEKAKRILILPLTIHSEKDLTFLNKGIMDMMAARISQSASVIREDAPAPGRDPVQMGSDLKADYVVTGSLTVFGDSASTDAALTAVDSGDTALQYSQFGQSSGDVLMHVNQFATQVSEYIESLSAAASPTVAAPTAAAPAVMIPQVAPPVQPVQPLPPAAAAAPQTPAAPVTAAAPVVLAAKAGNSKIT